MQRSPPNMGVSKCLMIGGSGLLLFTIGYWRWRKSKSSRRGETCGQEQARELAALRRAVLNVPVEVDVDKLPKGWAVAPPIFYPPRLAAISLLQPGADNDTTCASGSSFIICDGPLTHGASNSVRPEDAASFFTKYVQSAPLLESVASSGAVVVPLEEAGFSCVSGCFTHAMLLPAEEMALMFGCNGPYVISLVLTQFVVQSKTTKNCGDDDDGGDKNEDNATPQRITPCDIQVLLDACLSVPLVDGLRLPGTPAGSCEGRLRLTCRHKNRNVVFAVSTVVTARSVGGNKGKKKGNALFILEGDVLPDGRILMDIVSLDSIVKGAAIDTLFPCGVQDTLPVSSFVSVVAVEEIGSGVQNDNDAGQNASGNVPRLWCEEEDLVTIAFSHTSLGVHFAVNPRGGVVREPILTDDLLMLYYPLGEEGTTMKGADAALSVVPPRVTIRRITQVPPTWEKFIATEDELKHNVLFHFTDWAKERVPCTVCDLNGIRCVQLHEEKEEHSCRSYVIPWSHDILVVRWETETSKWEQHLPLLQKFLDTLHLADPSV
ncbi:hypothetical protein DQ04_07151010 [Trypanosoma grayi]|uniref:hypothetical protein n=1 Tax=Trypanosoma grayi TaxID=71804 RepID=UPI0004F4B0E5|nr:hypothetical protein DQ04_07151010 [Trypanosoma grayi]KEG08454.1 hypothetical protein DQ04_07151010 [Trypanosoma grayi]